MSQNKNKYEDVSILIREAEQIAAPAGVVLMNESSIHKTSAAIVPKRYETLLNQSQVLNHYKLGLESAGWRRLNGSERGIHEYCKGGLRPEVEFNLYMGFYTFSVIWRQQASAKYGAKPSV